MRLLVEKFTRAKKKTQKLRTAGPIADPMFPSQMVSHEEGVPMSIFHSWSHQLTFVSWLFIVLMKWFRRFIPSEWALGNEIYRQKENRINGHLIIKTELIRVVFGELA